MLLFFSLVGPLKPKFEPSKYIKEWLNFDRSADDMGGSKVAENTHGDRYLHDWSLTQCCELSRNRGLCLIIVYGVFTNK